MSARYFLGILLILAKPMIYAQASQPAAFQETVSLSLNTPVLLSGETLWFQLHALNAANQQPSLVSQMAYVQLINQERKTVLAQKIPLHQGQAGGSIFVTPTWPTGSYKLIAYTLGMLQVSRSRYFEADVTVINPFETPSPDTFKQNPVTPAAPETASKAIVLEQKTAGTRQHMNVGLQLPGNGHYTISIRRRDSLDGLAFSRKQVLGTAVPNPANYWPELRGEWLTGRLESGLQPVQNVTVALSVPGKNYTFKLANTDQNGKFAFVLDEIPVSGALQLQVLHKDRAAYTIRPEAALQPDLSALVLTPPALSPGLAGAIATRSVAAQVENAYYAQKQDSVKIPDVPKLFYEPLGKTYLLDDYTRFATLRETITEVLAEMGYRKHNGKYNILLRHYGKDLEVFGAPLVLVDGIPVQDHQLLFDWPADNLYSVTLVNEPYVYGPRTFGGLIDFRSKRQDFTLPEGSFLTLTDWTRPAPAKTPFEPEYHTKPQPRIPDYRAQLLWIGDIGTQRDFSFYTSDISGTYEVVLEGFTADGKPLRETTTFLVE